MSYGSHRKIDIRRFGGINQSEWYGIEINQAIADPEHCITTIGRPDLHTTLPVHAQMVPALINDDGTVNKYLKLSDFRYDVDDNAVSLDGSQGQVMIKIPAYYEKILLDGDKIKIMWSTKPLIGFTYKPAWWLGAYLAYIDPGSGKLTSRTGVMATTNKPRDEFRTAAELRGSNWCLHNYDVWRFLNHAVWIKYKTLNSQSSLALGDGATNASSTDWSNYNGYYPVVQNGLKLSADDVEVDFSVENFVGGTGTLESQAACFMGIEHVFGHIWQYIDGLNLHNSIANGARAFICHNPANFADDTETNYALAGNIAEIDGYIKKVLSSGPLPKSMGSSSSTYFSDYHYSSYAYAPDVGWRGSLVGGRLNYGSAAGLASSSFTSAASRRSAIVGSRLCLRVA